MSNDSALKEFILFGLKQAWACLFGGLLLFFILVTHYWYPFQHYLNRYDFLFLVAILIQVILLLTKLETWEEARLIIIFHIVATIMEIFKTSPAIGSWHYPEAAVFKIANVPLFAGFMYSAVGSYTARIWKAFDLKFTYYPKSIWPFIVAILIYINFFTHHFFCDLRWLLIAISIIVFARTSIIMTIGQNCRKMPLVVGWFLEAIFIWFAENIATLSNVWLYPFQNESWQPVSFHKIYAWYLLIIISFILVSTVHKPTLKRES
ncbi:MAG: DUF817 domain-containing protein [Gammaproteobacteria bacterium]|nr:DUF817 domain-containing protein [Gammaproteobacteria bacterium]